MKPCHLDNIKAIVLDRGQQQYDGEAISQLDHALQCAAQAQASGATPHLISACLLHDLGHLLEELAVEPRHEYAAIARLQSLFPPSVTEPIRLHVAAKRYLCRINPAYPLSPASQQSLQLQGGAFSAIAAQRFIAQPFAQAAVQLRIWDDQAKQVGAITPSLEDFWAIVQGIYRENRSCQTALHCLNPIPPNP
jgi:phosphonate degradation associated HDIG domain protein